MEKNERYPIQNGDRKLNRVHMTIAYKFLVRGNGHECNNNSMNVVNANSFHLYGICFWMVSFVGWRGFVNTARYNRPVCVIR